jgi:hypothetical protein
MCKESPWVQRIIATTGVIALIVASVGTIISGFLYVTTRNASETQLRAYLIAESPGPLIVRSTENDRTAYAIDFAFDNMGQTPAYNVHTRVAITTADSPLTADIGLDDFASLVDRGVVGKRAQYGAIITRGFTPQEVQQIADGAQRRLYVRGHVCYITFTKPRHLSFCFAYLGEKVGAFTACGWPYDFEDADCPELFSSTKMPAFATTHVLSPTSVTFPPGR